MRYAPAACRLPDPDLGSDTLLCLGNSILLEVDPGYERYDWSNGSTLSYTEVADTGQYRLTIRNGPCTASDTIHIGLCPDLPQVTPLITPNGDGYNDVLFIREISQYQDNHLTVFNRWGQQVHQAHNYQNDWNCTSSQGPLPDGAYYYVLTFRNHQGKQLSVSGAFTLVR